MKPILAPACLALALLLTAVPARADHRDRDRDRDHYDEGYRDEKRRVEKTWNSVRADYYHAMELRRRYGASSYLQRDFARADYLYHRIDDEMGRRDASLGRIRDELSDFRIAVNRINASYRDYSERPRYREIPRYRYYDRSY